VDSVKQWSALTLQIFQRPIASLSAVGSSLHLQ